MYGKFFASAFTGSMVGSGAQVFAVWGYIISHCGQEGLVELNSKLVAVQIGMSEDQVDTAVAFLCGPDTHSRSKKLNGARLVRHGEFLFEVPNYLHYRGITDNVARREANKQYQRDSRKRKAEKTVSPSVSKSPDMSAQVEEEEEVEEEVDTNTGRSATVCARDFENWWKGYPKKVKKKSARVLWMSKQPDVDVLIADVANRIANDDQWRRGFIPHPTTYLSQERWNDEIAVEHQEPSYAENLARKMEQRRNANRQ